MRILGGAERSPFPVLDLTGLSPTRAAIVTQLRTEYDLNRSAQTYSEGIDEPWCADFVSYTMRESVVPLTNPNSSSWRIPVWRR